MKRSFDVRDYYGWIGNLMIVCSFLSFFSFLKINVLVIYIVGFVGVGFSIVNAMRKKNLWGYLGLVLSFVFIVFILYIFTFIYIIYPDGTPDVDRGSKCLDAVSQVFIENQGLTCFDSVGDYVDIQVRHGAKDFGLSGINVLLVGEGEVRSTIVTEGLPGVNEESVIRVEAAGKSPEKVEIAPIVAVGNSEEACGVSSSLVLGAC